MDDRRLGARRDDDEVAVPRRELLEGREQLLALRSALGAAEALVALPRRELEPLQLGLGALAGRGTRRPRGLQQRTGGVGRLERVIRIGRPRDAEKLVAAPDRLGIEQPLGAVEPTGGDACERSRLGLVQPRRAARQELPDRTLREPPERDELAARADRRGQRAELVGHEQDQRVRRWLLQVLQQRVGRILVQQVRREDHVDAP